MHPAGHDDYGVLYTYESLVEALGLFVLTLLTLELKPSVDTTAYKECSNSNLPRNILLTGAENLAENGCRNVSYTPSQECILL